MRISKMLVAAVAIVISFAFSISYASQFDTGSHTLVQTEHGDNHTMITGDLIAAVNAVSEVKHTNVHRTSCLVGTIRKMAFINDVNEPGKGFRMKHEVGWRC